MNLITVIILGLSFTVVYGSRCIQLSGKWKNELGSVMILQDLPNSHITGWYQTSVVSRTGAASSVSNITGVVMPVKDGSLLAFSVIFNHGLSLTTWVGQCMTCNGKEKIFTTYIYRRHSSMPTDDWSSTAVNQNTFWRVEDNTLTNSEVPARNMKLQSLNTVDGTASIDGEWISNHGEKIEFTASSTNKTFIGKYRDMSLIGHWDEKDGIAAFGFASYSSKSIKGWTGYLSTSSHNSQKLARTSWLEHSFNSNCQEPRKMLHFGMDDYTHMSTSENFAISKADTFFEKIRKFFKSLF